MWSTLRTAFSEVLRSWLPVTEDRRVSEAIDVMVEVRSRQHCPLITCWNEKKTQTGQTVDMLPHIKSHPSSAEIQLTWVVRETFNSS